MIEPTSVLVKWSLNNSVAGVSTRAGWYVRLETRQNVPVVAVSEISVWSTAWRREISWSLALRGLGQSQR